MTKELLIASKILQSRDWQKIKKISLRFSTQISYRKAFSQRKSSLWLTLKIKIVTLQSPFRCKLKKTLSSFYRLITNFPKFSKNFHWLAATTPDLTLLLLPKGSILTKLAQTYFCSKFKAGIVVRKQRLIGKLWVQFFRKDYNFTKRFPNWLTQGNKTYSLSACKIISLSQFSRIKTCMKFTKSIKKKFQK